MDNRIVFLKWIRFALTDKATTLPDSLICECISRILNSELVDGRSKYEWYDGMIISECIKFNDIIEMRGYTWNCNGKKRHKTNIKLSIINAPGQEAGYSLEYSLPEMSRMGIIYIGAVQQVDSAEASTIAVPNGPRIVP